MSGRWSQLTQTMHNMVPVPGVQPESLRYIDARWQGYLTAEMSQLLQATCGLSGTPLGNVDFTGCWYPEEPLALFRPCLTPAIDDEGRRWIAEAARTRGLPGPVWCIDPNRQVALYVDRRLQDFLRRLDGYGRRGRASLWSVAVAARLRPLSGGGYNSPDAVASICIPRRSRLPFALIPASHRPGAH